MVKIIHGYITLQIYCHVGMVYFEVVRFSWNFLCMYYYFEHCLDVHKFCVVTCALLVWELFTITLTIVQVMTLLISRHLEQRKSRLTRTYQKVRYRQGRRHVLSPLFKPAAVA